MVLDVVDGDPHQCWSHEGSSPRRGVDQDLQLDHLEDFSPKPGYGSRSLSIPYSSLIPGFA